MNKNMKTLSLFSGIGGLDLGFERAGFEIVAQCEQNEYCRRVLAKHWPGIPCHKDVKDVGRDTVPGRIECVIGGFPCQDISSAGNKVGITGKKSSLWLEMLRVIREVRPDWVCAENVAAIRRRGLDEVLDGLEDAGYTAWTLDPPSSCIGLPQQRDRVFIVAHSHDSNKLDVPLHAEVAAVWDREPMAWRPDPSGWSSALGVDDGVPSRMDRMRALGNAVCPPVAEMIARAILAADEVTR